MKLPNRSKLSSAIRMALFSIPVAVTLVACDGATSTSVVEDNNNQAQVHEPTGSIVGVVQDTNGNPVEGASVYLGSNSTTTSAGGTYQFDDVQVADLIVSPVGLVDGIDGEDVRDNGNVIDAQALQLSIVPPTGFLGATVTVTPKAIIDWGTLSILCDSGDEYVDRGESCDSTNTFVDGFTASAGTAVLPAIGTGGSTVTGVLRDYMTGVIIAGQTISLEFLESSLDIDQEQEQDGVTTSYQTLNYTATSDATGNFSITGVPNDSHLMPVVGNHEVQSVDYNGTGSGVNIETSDEVEVVDLGNVHVIAHVANDEINPYVTMVTGVVDQDAGTGLFNDDIDGTAGIDIKFSEIIDGSLIDANSVIVWDEINGYQTDLTPTLSADGMTLTITTLLALPAGEDVKVYLLKADFNDGSGNALIDDDEVGFDNDDASSSGAQYVRLDTQIFEETNLDAQATTTLAQVLTVIEDDGEVHMLDNDDDDDSFGGLDTEERLQDLEDAVAEDPNDIFIDSAIVSFTPTNASFYTIDVFDDDGNDVTSLGDIELSDNAEFGGGNDFDSDSALVEIALTNVSEDDSVVITPFDDFGRAGTATTVTLVDYIAPTVVLQNSYDTNPDSSFLVVSEQFGDGGELSNEGEVTPGTPYLNVTPQMLDNLDDAGDEVLIAGDDDDTLDHELLANNTVDSLGTGVVFIDQAYDEGAYMAMAAAANRTIGVAFSEGVEAITDPAYDGISTFGTWSASNDVTVEDDGDPVNVDLMISEVSSVLTLAADDGSTLDFDGDVQDEDGNVAGLGNTSTIIRDALPPFMSVGTYDGDSISATFDEEVLAQDGDTFSFLNAGGFIMDAASLSVFPANGDISAENYSLVDNLDGTFTLTIDSDAWSGDLDLVNIFHLPTYAVSGTVGHHSPFTFFETEDTNGNNWDGESAGVTPVPFALRSDVDRNFTITIGDGLDTAITSDIIVTMTHRIDATLIDGDPSTITFDVADLIANGNLVFLNGGGININTIDTALSSVSLSADGRTLTMSLVDGNFVQVAFDSGDSIDMTFDSDWDSSQSDSDIDTI